MSQRVKKSFSEGIVVINATFNNTLVTVTTRSGDVLCRSSAGHVGFKGSRKGTPYAAQLAAEKAAKDAREKYGLSRVLIRVKGPGAGRDSAIRAVRNAGIAIIALVDVTRLPHNGCRRRKKRRV